MSRTWRRVSLGNGVLRFDSPGCLPLLAPAQVGDRYEVDGVVTAEGGFGVIFTARDNRLENRRVMIKARKYPPTLFRFPQDEARQGEIERLRRLTYFEARCLVRFRQAGESRIPCLNEVCTCFAPALIGPHVDANGAVWQLHDPTITHREPFLVVQAISGTTLTDCISQGLKSFHWEWQVLEMGLELCTILQRFHAPVAQNGQRWYFIYQDLKPDNVILSHGAFLTLIDFGGMTLVKSGRDGRMSSNWQAQGSPGLGTWGYKAPEMHPDNGCLAELDQRVDVYALGATLFHLLTGTNPAGLPNAEYGPLPLERLGSVSEQTRKLITKALEPDREKRYTTVKSDSTGSSGDCLYADILNALKEGGRRPGG